MTNTGGSIVPAKEFEGKLWILADAYQQAMQAAYMGGVLAEREIVLQATEELYTLEEDRNSMFSDGYKYALDQIETLIRARGKK
jgi:hypothetical protein